jgi:phage/plasmid-like protein (TIGR03299 family)
MQAINFGHDLTVQEQGKALLGLRNWKDVVEKANLNWKVVKEKLHDIRGNVISQQGIFREDNHTYLGPVKSRFTPIQNESQFSWVDSVIVAEPTAYYENAGSLHNGELVYCSVRLPDKDFYIQGTDDVHHSYLYFINWHSVVARATAFFNHVRMVCTNMIRRMLQNAKNLFKIGHNKQSERRLDESKTLMLAAGQQLVETRNELNHLAKTSLTVSKVDEIINRLLLPPTNPENTGKRDRIVSRIKELFEINDNNQFPQIRGTAYALFNAFTNFTDHERSVRVTQSRKGSTKESLRSESAIFGNGAKFKEQVLYTLLEAA